MSTSIVKALRSLCYAMTGQASTKTSAVKVIDDITANLGSSATATTTTAGLMKQGAAVADAASSPTKAEFNALTKSLRDAGIIAPNSES